MRKASSLVLIGMLTATLFAGYVNMGSYSAKAFTAVSGSVSGTWDLANSPYYVEGTVWIDSGNSLTIDPGVVVQVNGSYEIVVNGTLIANGALGQEITITSNMTAPPPAVGDWIGIRIARAAPAVNGDGIFNYTNISFARDGINITGTNKQTIVDNCTFYMNGNGIALTGSMTNPSQNHIITNSLFWNNTQNGTFMRNADNNQFINNTFLGNENGITTPFFDFMTPSSAGNTFSGNTFQYTNNSAISIFGNVFMPSTTNNLFIDNVIIDGNNSLQLIGEIGDTIINNKVMNNQNGVVLAFDSYTSVIGNNITGIPAVGLGLVSSPDNEVSLNEISSNGQGIFLFDISQMIGFGEPSNRNFIGNNTVISNMFGVSIAMCDDNILFNNTVNYSVVDNVDLTQANFTTLFLNHMSYSQGGMGLYAVDSNNLTIVGNALVQNQQANMNLVGITDSLIDTNFPLFSVNDVGMGISDSRNLNVANNTMLGNQMANLMLYNTTIVNLNLNNASSGMGMGIYAVDSTNLTMTNNMAIGNVDSNIALSNVTGAVLTANNASFSQTQSGIVLALSIGDNLYDNVGYGNAQFGLLMFYSDSITVDNGTHTLNAIGGMGLFSTNNSYISNSVTSDNFVGIQVESSEYDTLYNINASNTVGGVYLNGTQYTMVEALYVYNDISSQNWGAYLFNSNNNTVTNVVASGCGEAAIAVDTSSYNYISDNILIGNNNGTAVNSSSMFNNFAGNNISSSTYNGYWFSDQADSNTLWNEQLWNNPVGVYANSSTDILFINSTIMSLGQDFALYSDAHVTALNVSSNFVPYFDDALSNLTVQWYLDVKVVDGALAPVANAELVLVDLLGTEVYNSTVQGTTDGSGYVRWLVVTEYVEDQLAQVFYTPHNATAWKFNDIGYNESSIDVSMEMWVMFTMKIDPYPPEFTSFGAQPDPQEIYGFVNITALIDDPFGVYGVWVEITDPNSGPVGNFSMIYDPISGEWYWEQAYDILGTYTFTIWTNDTMGNWNSTSGSFLIRDSTAPVLSLVSAQPDPQEVQGNVNVSANITDNYQLAGAYVNVTDPYGNPVGNFTMTYDPVSGTWYWNQTYDILGMYAFTIWAGDSEGNWGSSTGSFDMQDWTAPAIVANDAPDPQDVNYPVNITADVTDFVGVGGVWVNIAGVGNFSMSLDAVSGLYYYNATYGTVMTFSYTVWANDTSDNWNSATGLFDIITDSEKPTISNLLETPDPVEINGNVNITVNITDNVMVDDVWINITGVGNYTMTKDLVTGLYYYNASQPTTGTFSYTIWTNDTKDNWNSTASSFVVQDSTNPTADAGADKSSVANASVSFDGSGSSDNDAIDNYTWVVRDSNNAIVVTLYGASPSYTFALPGNYTVTLTVRDPSGNSDTDTMTVTVTESGGGGPGPGGGNFLSDYWWLLLLIVIIVVVLLLLLILMMRRKKPEEGKPAEGEGKAGKEGAGEETEEEEIEETEEAEGEETEEIEEEEIEESEETSKS